MTVLAVLGIAALTLACARPGASEPGRPESSDGTASADPAPSFGSGAVPADALERVIADAASGAGVDPEDVAVVSAEAVTWSDGSLGCPQPGQMYTQALVPGFRVVLDVDGEEMTFHAGEDAEFTFCADPQPPVDDGRVDS